MDYTDLGLGPTDDRESPPNVLASLLPAVDEALGRLAEGTRYGIGADGAGGCG